MNMVKCGEKEFIAKFLEVYPKSYIVNQWVPKVCIVRHFSVNIFSTVRNRNISWWLEQCYKPLKIQTVRN